MELTEGLVSGTTYSDLEVINGTAGYADVALRYARRTSGMDNNEWLYVEWWDGAAWRVAEQTRTTAAGVVDAMLPASADGNGAFRIRFRSKANQSSTEWADVDSVEVIGTPLP